MNFLRCKVFFSFRESVWFFWGGNLLEDLWLDTLRRWRRVDSLQPETAGGGQSGRERSEKTTRKKPLKPLRGPCLVRKIKVQAGISKSVGWVGKKMLRLYNSGVSFVGSKCFCFNLVGTPMSSSCWFIHGWWFSSFGLLFHEFYVSYFNLRRRLYIYTPIHDMHHSLVGATDIKHVLRYAAYQVTLRPRGNEPLGETWAEGRVFAVGDCNYGYLAQGRFFVEKIWGKNMEKRGWRLS